MISYFDKKNTGGSYASKGFEYQDYCCLCSVFQNIDKKEFKCISIEGTNDFSIIFESHEKSVQVKKREINLTMAISLLEKINFDNENIYEFVCTNVSSELSEIMNKTKWLKNLLNSPKNETEKLKAKKDFINELKKLNIDHMHEKLLYVEFTTMPEQIVELCMNAYYFEWLKNNNLSLNNDELLKTLFLIISKMRSQRGFLIRDKVKELIEKYGIENSMNAVFDKLYTRHFKSCSEILKILGDNKDEIISELEKNIKKADNYIENNKFNEALNIYSSLANLYEKEELLINCAKLSEVTKKYNDLICYCNKILDLNSKNFEAYFMLGTTYVLLDKKDEALNYLIQAKQLKESPEVYYNIGYIYHLKNDRNNAYKNYAECLKLDNTFVRAHLNISDFENLYNAICHLDKVIDLDYTIYRAYAKKGEILRYIGLYELAIKYFKKCLDYDKENTEALRGIALSCFELGKYDEAITYLSNWFKKDRDKLLCDKIENGKLGMILDVKWHTTRVILYEKVDNNTVIIKNQYNGDIQINLSENEGSIFIGCMIDKYGEILLPIVGKRYDLQIGYQNVKNYILKNPNLEVIGKGVYEDINASTKVIISEYADYVHISIKLENYEILGHTENKENGFEKFLEEYSLCQSIGILLENKLNDEKTLITGIMNVTLEKYDIRCPNYINDITKKIIEEAMKPLKN